MNDRIRELAEQARDYVADAIELGFPQDQIDDIRDEKFAELIVKDCISTINKRFMGDLNREDMEVRRCIEDVKKHFGVEE